jgi:hypothetical protein
VRRVGEGNGGMTESADTLTMFLEIFYFAAFMWVSICVVCGALYFWHAFRRGG